MTIGSAVRHILGEKYFLLVGDFYRSLFVDLDAVCDNFPTFKAASHVLDIGGGDGAIANRILMRYPDIFITMIDLAPQIGTSVQNKNKERVDMRPCTSIRQFNAVNKKQINYIVISDVIHHIPIKNRPLFFRDVIAVLANNEGAKLIIKDIEPGHFISYMSLFSDKYITGDRHTTLIKKKEVIDHIRTIDPMLHYVHTKLWEHNKPNYCMIFQYK